MIFNTIDRRQEGTTLLRKCQLTQLYMLDVFKEICEKYELKYFLVYGTLLGAVRHGGAIPWDDDVDVAMPMRDYKRFVRIAPAELPEFLMLQTPKRCPGVFAYFAKIRDRRTYIIEGHSLAQHPSGIFIDIFPFERIPRLPTPVRKLLVGSMSYFWRKSRKHRTMYHRTCLGVLVSAFLSLFFSVSHVCSRLLCRGLAFVCPCDWGECPEAGGADTKKWFMDEIIFPLSKVRYEHSDYCAPHDCDAWLTINFGDWRTPPPESNRVGHSSLMSVERPIPSRWSLPVGGWNE